MSAYRNRKIVLATMHGKEQAIAPAVSNILGAELIVSHAIDTDQFGTFSGEIARQGTMRETAIRKARLAIAMTGHDFAIASEGTYGPHPFIPFVPGGTEALVFIDQQRDVIVTESLIEDAPCFEHDVISSLSEIDAFISRIDFPNHAIIMRPNKSELTTSAVFKGVRSRASLEQNFSYCKHASHDHRVLVQTDMRAHFNPTRMKTIAKLAEQLCRRLATQCPRCNQPAFGRKSSAPGLPCMECGTATHQSRGAIVTCDFCQHQEFYLHPQPIEKADPRFCPLCNP